MRLLVVGHSYVVPYNQQKYEVMKRQNPSLQLRIVTPPILRDVYRGSYFHSVCPGLTTDEAVSMKTFFSSSYMTYIHDPIAFIKLLLKFKPDLIHIEEDPHSLIALETILLTSLCRPKTPISFFIWDNMNRKPRFPLNVIKSFLMHFSLGRAAGVVTGNQEAQNLLGPGKKYYGPSAVLPQLGIACEKFHGSPRTEIARRVGRQDGIPVIGFMSRLVPEKGILLLCEALEGLQHLPWKLIIISAGPLQDDLQNRWKPLFGERLLLLGPGERADLPDYLKCMDILVAPSMSTPQWKEQFGYILVEAMASGAAVIGSSSGAIPEVIGNAGIVFPESDVSRLKDALMLLLQSPEKRKEFSRLGRARSQELFSHEVVSATYMKLFQQFSQL